MNLLEKIRQEYDLCITKPEDYKEKVDSVSDLLGLKGKYRLISEHCPVYFVGKYDKSPIIIFGLNPGHSETNSPIEDKGARISWKRYQVLYRDFFSYFGKNGFESPYYTSLWYLLTGLMLNQEEEPEMKEKWKFFESHLTNMELIPYHSRGITIPSILNDHQLNYLIDRLEENINFIVNFKPKLFIFNGSTWYTLLIKTGSSQILRKFQ